MGDVRYPLLGAFIRKHSDSVKEENESFEWVPHGCRLVHPDGVSGESRLVGFSIDGSASLVSNTEGPVNPKMEPPSFGLGEEVKASDKEDGAIEERSILLIGDSHVRALAEDLTRSFAGGVDPSVQEHKNEASSSGVGRKFAMHIGKTVVLDVQRKSGNGRVRVHIQYQFDPFLYHLGNISASAQAKMTLSAQEVYANSQRQRSVYTAGVAGPEVPSFLPPFQEHVFDAVIFNFGHWPASSKLLGGHWTTDQVLAHLKLVVNSLKDYGNLRMREYEHIRHEEQQRHNYFSRMYGGGRSSHLHSSPSSRSNKPYRALQTLFLGMPAVRPRADTFVKEAGDWKNNYRLAYWSSLAEELMTSNGIPTFDSFGVTLPAASDAIDGAYSLNQEVADAIVAAVIHFLDV
ncbi:hypothetical protein DFQ27_004817 [Actinomortierella ambigua]|uniref:Uncharacterized protein n=1 Tax=Actinomortierella ambigua TaxID=1343610 RepID=A0A9P6Q0P6_9FUNG|nr:hypothetical protein DFQ27_004817 [Actinomortierella ambigua]